MLAGLLALSGFVAYYFFSLEGQLVRVLLLLVGLALGGFVASQSTWGISLLGFLQETRTEVRRVVWPTRQETTQVTLAVLAMVLVTSLFLWGVDTLLFYFVRLIAG